MRMPNPTAVPRAAVDLTLRTTRLPLAAAARVGRRDEATWLPTLAYDSVDAAVRQAAGWLLHDEELVAGGRREQRRVRHLGEALDLQEQAEVRRREADDRLDRRRDAAERRRREVDEQAEQARQRVDEERVARERAVQQSDRRRRQRADEVAQQEEATVSRRRRQARATEADAEEQALLAEAEATREEAGVLALDQQLDKSRRRRRASAG